MNEPQQYYISYHNAIYGPYTIAELAPYITPGTLLCQAGQDAWHTAADIPDLKELLDGKTTQLEPDQPPGSIYYVLGSGKEYGPYSLTQLLEFITPETKVRLGSGTRWMQSAELAELREHFSRPGQLEPKYWFYYEPDGEEVGPFSRAELLSLINEDIIQPETQFKHFSWNSPIRLADSKLYRELHKDNRGNAPAADITTRSSAGWKLALVLVAFALIAIPLGIIFSSKSSPPDSFQPTTSTPLPVSEVTATEIFGAIETEPRTSGQLQITMIDVGQGDGFVIRTPSGKTYIIDAGNSSSRSMIPYLHKLGVTEIEGIMISHPHQDHIGGIDELINEFPIKKLYDPGRAHTSRTYRSILQLALANNIEYIEVRAGDLYHWDDGVDVEVFHPTNPEEGGINNSSIVCRLSYGTNSILFTGDAEVAAENQILTRYRTEVASDVLKVGHHGSHSSTSEAWLAAVRPEIGLISCGLGNSYGHPHHETIENLKQAGVTSYRTDQVGIVTLYSDGKNWQTTIEGTIYDQLDYRFTTPTYQVSFDDEQTLLETAWATFGPDGHADITDGALVVYTEPEQQLYTSPGSSPVILKRAPSGEHWLTVVKMRGSSDWKTDGTVMLFTNATNWVALSCAEQKNISLISCRQGESREEYFALKKIPLFYAFERIGDRINIAVSQNRITWVVVKRYQADELGINLDDLQIGFGANSWGENAAQAWFFEYCEYTN